MSINFIDALLVLLVLLSVFGGWQRGFLRGLLDLVRWAASLLAGLRFYQPVARLVQPLVNWPEVWVRPFAFLLTASLTGLLVHLLGRLLMRKLSEDVHERRANRLLGLLPGLINGLIAAAIAAPLLLALPLPGGLGNSTRESVLASRLGVLSGRLESALSPVFDEAISRTLNLLTVRPEPESNETVRLPYKVAETKPRADLEKQMLDLVNGERVKAGLQPLAPDAELTEVARKHSADMFARGYFSHYSPEGRSPFDRMREARVTYLTAGENLALAPTLTIAHNGLMNSPGHRANILRGQFGRVGIGVMDGGWRGLMISQEFRN
ncbi:MAG TPA: CvpA family protein [Pyrinomonadaceae bacterium]